MGGAGAGGTVRVVGRRSSGILLLAPLALLLAGCGDLDRTGLQQKLAADTNHYIGTEAVASVRCTPDRTVAGASYKCIVVPSNGRKGIPIFVAVHGSSYTILPTPKASAAR